MLKNNVSIAAVIPVSVRGNGCFCLVILFLCFVQTPAAANSYETAIVAAAEGGDPQSQFALGLLYEHGAETIDRNPEQAIFWFEKAGRERIAGACLYLGLKYEYGNRVKKDLVQAACWYECAARKDWPAAQYFLATMYEKGKGVVQSSFNALVWFGLAAEYEYPGAEAEFLKIQSSIGLKNMDRLRRTQRQLLQSDGPICN